MFASLERFDRPFVLGEFQLSGERYHILQTHMSQLTCNP